MRTTLIALALAAALPLSAQAAERSYTFVEGTYNNIDADGIDRIDGLGLRGSVAFADTGFYGLGSYQNYSENGADADLWELGLGYAHGLADNVDQITEAAYADAEGESGYRVSTGLRGSLTSNLEGLAKVSYRDYSNVNGDFTGTFGLQYRFDKTWGVTGEIEFDDSARIYTVGVRASF